MKHMYIYRIRDRNTGKFSNGGISPKFGKTGKIWTSAGALRRHLNIVIEGNNADSYANCEVIEYTLDGQINRELTHEIEKAVFEEI